MIDIDSKSRAFRYEVGPSTCTGKFICFEGIDGSGKSTIASLVAEQLRSVGINAVFASRFLMPEDQLAAERLNAVGDMLWNYPRNADIQSLGDRHLILLMASWYYLFNDLVIRPELEKGRMVITDQWIYKYLARFRVKQAFWSESLFDQLTCPDCVILLDISPEIASTRKAFYKATETGASDLGSQFKPEFVSFQHKVSVELSAYRRNWWHTIDASQKLDTVVASSVRAVCNLEVKNFARI